QNGARFVLGNVVEVMGSRVVIEMDEWNGRKSYTAFVQEKRTRVNSNLNIGVTGM
nr:hypothetical protein [Tanacetum cinerariifolium]GEW99116.1 hypothetical protein [Tanacetum cinerariifolium]